MIPTLLAVLGLGALFVLFGLLHLWRGDAPTGSCGGGGNCGACDGSGHCADDPGDAPSPGSSGRAPAD